MGARGAVAAQTGQQGHVQIELVHQPINVASSEKQGSELAFSGCVMNIIRLQTKCFGLFLHVPCKMDGICAAFLLIHWRKMLRESRAYN